MNIHPTVMSDIDGASVLSSKILDSSSVPFDENLLIARSLSDIPSFSEDHYKGGIYPNALPVDVWEDISSISPEDKSKISSVVLAISPKNGLIDFPISYRKLFHTCTLDYIEDFSKKFNESGDWVAEFKLMQHLNQYQMAPSFHPDSWSASDIRAHRAFIPYRVMKPGKHTKQSC